jgi:hypothetical protein
MIASDKSEKLAMHSLKSKPGRVARRPLLPDLAATLQPAKDAAARLKRSVERFAVYDLLKEVYRIHMEWKHHKIAKISARTLADELGIVRRKGTSPIRVLIEATLLNADIKQKSRWVRALEYAAYEGVSPNGLRKFIHAHGGLAGCARLSAQAARKRRRPGGDWND